MAPIATLVAAAAEGDKAAWDEIVERCSGLVFGICRRWRLGDIDLHNVSQTVWLRLAEQLSELREPAALPGWLATTTRNECLRVLRAAGRRREAPLPPDGPRSGGPDEDDIVEESAQAERRLALRQAFDELPEQWRQLLVLLTTDPCPSYAEISSRLGIPIGTVGPTRARCLSKLRRSPALAALLSSNPRPAGEHQPERRPSRRGSRDA